MKVALVVMTAALLTACASHKTVYSWGSYEDLIYGAYNAPGKLAPEQQIEILEKEYQKIRASNTRVPPGWHAHLGYLYASIGKTEQAQQELRTEKAEFPESAVFVDRLIANLGSPQ